MLDSLLESVITGSTITASAFLVCTLISMLLGVGVAALCMYKNKYSQSFAVTLAMLPAMVAVVIMLVNGNIGAGVAVAGGFSLVRFRSAPGTAREILMIFLAMAAGLICGTGYLAFALLFTLIMSACCLIAGGAERRFMQSRRAYKTLSVTIPEDLDYTGVFSDIFGKYTESAELTKVKTTNMGSMFKLSYDIVLKDLAAEKEMIDMLRTRNGNLEISVSNQEIEPAEL